MQKRRYPMKEGLLDSRDLSKGGKAEIWCIAHRPEDAFTHENDVAVVEVRFTATRPAKTVKAVRRRFRKMYPGALESMEQEKGSVVQEFYCEPYDTQLWNTLLVHCLTKEVVDTVIHTFSNSKPTNAPV